MKRACFKTLKLQNFMRSLSQNIAVLTPVVAPLAQNWLEKVPKLVSHVLMVIERYKSTLKGALR